MGSNGAVKVFILLGFLSGSERTTLHLNLNAANTEQRSKKIRKEKFYIVSSLLRREREKSEILRREREI